jgi:hypothetical protein
LLVKLKDATGGESGTGNERSWERMKNLRFFVEILSHHGSQSWVLN